MKTMTKVMGVLLMVGTLFVGIGFALPQTVSVERSVVIDAPADVIFARLNSYKTFNQWSPWAERDPNTKYTFSGPESGVGAGMAWESDNSSVGKGSQEIIQSTPNTYIQTDLDFGHEGVATAEFKLDENGGKTTVTWGLTADMGENAVGRWMGLMMDKWVGEDYEKGLANLKVLVEKSK